MPWEHAVTMQTRWPSAYPMLTVFSRPGGQHFGEIMHHGGVVASSGSAYVSDAPPDAPPAGTPAMLARATVS